MTQLFTLRNPISSNGTVPIEFCILPLGLVHSAKCDFLVDNESFTAITKTFKERKLQLVVDYEHQTLSGKQAPAAGWVTNLVLKSDGIYATVDWTERATEYLKNKEYKYFSPVVHLNSDFKVIGLHSLALTNTPAMSDLAPLVNKAPNEYELSEEATELPKSTEISDLADLLELPTDATLADILEAIQQLRNQCTQVSLKLSAVTFEAHKENVNGLVYLGLKEGKILPYQRDWAFRSALKDFDEFALWLSSAPQIVPFGEIQYSNDCLENEKSTHSDRLLGLNTEDIERFRK